MPIGTFLNDNFLMIYMMNSSIVSGTYLGYGHDDAPERSEVLCVCERGLRAAAPRHVHVEAESGAGAAFARGAGAREEVAVVVSVYAHVQHMRVLVEDLLRAVAVVHVLIKHVALLQQVH